MDKSKRVKLIKLAGQTTLTGEVLAARWLLSQDSQTVKQRQQLEKVIRQEESALSTAEQVTRLLEAQLSIDLTDAITQVKGRTMTWWTEAQESILAVYFQLTSTELLNTPKPAMTLLGETSRDSQQVVHEAESYSEDGAMSWKLKLLIDSDDVTHCSADVEVMLLDSWDLSGTSVMMQWDDTPHISTTDERGHVRFEHIPLDSINKIKMSIVPQH